jgi:AcrR family transcriptional regulator
VSTAATRLSAAERRQAIVDAAVRVFSTGSYAGATTADIARAAGVSEPLLYRHFQSKRQLYFACLDEAWSGLRDHLVQAMDELGPAEAWREIGPTTMRQFKVLVPNLWMQAITEAGEDPEIRRHVRSHMREVHDFFAEALRRIQSAGVVPGDRDVDAEAWVFIAGSLLASMNDRLGGLLTEDDFTAIKTQRWRWLSGTA